MQRPPAAWSLFVVVATLLFAAPAVAQTPDIAGVLADRGLPFAFGLAFAGGVLLSLTPCVYPMIPITVAIFGARGATRLRGLALSASYVLGIAATYTALGIWAALSGRLFGSLLASPWVLGSFAVLFTFLGLLTLDRFPRVDAWLSRPAAWASRLGGGGLGGAFLMGTAAGVVFAPCVGPVLVGILAYVATTRDVVLGGSLLFAFALGMGMLFLVVGAFSGTLVRLPRSQALVRGAKLLLAALVFAGALYFWSLVLPADVFRWGLAGCLLLFAFELILPLRLADRAPLRRVAQSAGAALIVAAILVGAGAVGIAAGGARPGISWRKDYAAALREAQAARRPVLIDFTADWCIACKELDRFTFRNDRVIAAAERFVAVRVDATRMEGEAERIVQEHAVLGLPAVVFVDSSGRPLKDPRVTAYVEAEEMLGLMEQVQ